MKEYIVSVEDDERDFDEVFIGYIRKQTELIRCKDCEHLKVSGELEHMNGDTTFYYVCNYWHRATDEWRYCDEGARRKEDDDD